jgi:hypothetical protein
MDSHRSLPRYRWPAAASLVFALTLLSSGRSASWGSVETGSLVTTSARDSAASAVLEFSLYWGQLWRASESERHIILLTRGPSAAPHRFVEQSLEFRGHHIWCGTPFHNDPIATRPYLMIAKPHQIGWGLSERFGLCPSWLLGPVPSEDDEGEWLDAALTPRYRAQAREARAQLILRLGEYQRSAPDDAWITGQRVRFLVDQRSWDAAVEVARGCSSPRWWCGMLSGYTLASQGHLVAAEAAFASALAAMSVAEHCAWTDYGHLLPPPDRREYEALACTARDSLNHQLWWLADPLFTAPGNPRLVEQHLREVQLRLRASLDFDERYDWRAAAAGLARREMQRRYGWPTYAFWIGFGHDHNTATVFAHPPSDWRPSRARGPVADLYSTSEYRRDRQPFVPSWRAVQAPFSAEPDDWELTDPRPRSEVLAAGAFRGLGVSYTRFYNVGDSLRVFEGGWWPVEHARAHPYVAQLPAGQFGLFRRDSGAMLAFSTSLDAGSLRRPAGSVLAATAVASSHPERFDTIGTWRGLAGRVLAGRAALSESPAVVSVEIDAVDSLSAGRVRLGVQPRPALHTMEPGTYDVSAPVFLTVPDDDGATPLDWDRLLDRMLPAHAIERGARLGVYWESYGLSLHDTVDVAVWVQRFTPQSALTRLGIALNLIGDLNAPLEVRWREPAIVAARHPVAIDQVPVIARYAVIDVTGLAAGDYWLTVAIGPPDRPSVQSRRGFTISGERGREP